MRSLSHLYHWQVMEKRLEREIDAVDQRFSIVMTANNKPVYKPELQWENRYKRQAWNGSTQTWQTWCPCCGPVPNWPVATSKNWRFGTYTIRGQKLQWGDANERCSVRVGRLQLHTCGWLEPHNYNTILRKSLLSVGKQTDDQRVTFSSAGSCCDVKAVETFFVRETQCTTRVDVLSVFPMPIPHAGTPGLWKAHFPSSFQLRHMSTVLKSWAIQKPTFCAKPCEVSSIFTFPRFPVSNGKHISKFLGNDIDWTHKTSAPSGKRSEHQFPWNFNPILGVCDSTIYCACPVK